MKRYLILFVFLSVCLMNIGIAKADTNSDFDIQDGVLVKYNGEGGAVVIPEGVTSIGERAFSDCISLTDIVIPSSVRKLESFSFYGCTGLTSVTIPYGVAYIGEAVFENCSNLANITIPESVTTIGYSVFVDCTSLSSITIPDSVTFIGAYLFRGCSNLTSVTIPNSISSLRDGTFSGCSSLKNITIPENVYDIGSSTFSGCTSLSEITLPQSVISLGTYLFSGCNSLSKVYILNGKARGGEGTFPIDGVVYYVERNSDIESELKQLGATVAYLNPPESIDLKGYAVSISEKINLQFYYDIAESDIAGGDIFAKVNYPNGSIKRVYFDVNKKTIQDGKTYYAIECELAAKEMNDQVKIQLWNSETKKSCSEKVQYSVKEYLDDLLVFSSESEAEENLVNAMLTYGAYSQDYFQYNTEKLATELLSNYLTENVSSVNAYLNTLASDECVGELPDGISLYGSSLILESTIGYRLYFQADNSDTAKAYGLTYDAKEGYYYTELFSLSPLELNDLFEFELGDATIRSCPLRYVTYALGENRSDELKQLCVAIVNYHRAAEEYATYRENCSRNGTEILN